MTQNPTDGDPNPYAPPTVAEIEAPSGRYWHVEGVGVMVRTGAILPQVDLETGVSTGELKCVPRSFQQVQGMSTLIGVLAGIASFSLIRRFDIGPGFIFILVFSYLFLKKIGVIPGLLGKPGMFWVFIEERRAKRVNLRRRLRIGAMLVIFAAIVGVFLLMIRDPTTAGNNFNLWLRWVLFPGVAVILGVAIWSWIDGRPGYRIRDGVQGWFSISPIHPDALAFLNNREAERKSTENKDSEPKKWRIRTVYYYRYPLRMLLGKRIFNPLAFIQIGLMKLFRSRLLVRETYHYSESEKLPLEALSISIRKQVDAWFAQHGEWTFIAGERLPSPLGDITVDTAILAAPGLEHCVCFHYVWSPLKPHAGTVSVKFLSYSINGTSIWTQDHPHLDLNLPNVEEHRASGSPPRVFQAHLRNCEGHMIRGPGSAEELLRSIEDEKEITDRILTERGYQDEALQSE